MDVVHRIIDCQTCGDRPAGRVDIEVYRLLWVLSFEEEELGNDDGGEAIVDGAIEADDTFLLGWAVSWVIELTEWEGRCCLEEPREDII